MSEEKDAKIQELEAEIARLKDENSKLQETVQWMHDLIWRWSVNARDRKEIRPMVHTLVPMSVKIKIKNFETPARLINHMELSCAVGMACRQASLPCPEGTAGTDLKEFVKSVPDTIYSSSAVDEKLKVLIRDYIYKKGEVLDDDSLVTLKLGYENT